MKRKQKQLKSGKKKSTKIKEKHTGLAMHSWSDLATA